MASRHHPMFALGWGTQRHGGSLVHHTAVLGSTSTECLLGCLDPVAAGRCWAQLALLVWSGSQLSVGCIGMTSVGQLRQFGSAHPGWAALGVMEVQETAASAGASQASVRPGHLYLESKVALSEWEGAKELRGQGDEYTDRLRFGATTVSVCHARDCGGLREGPDSAPRWSEKLPGEHI